MGYTGRVTAFNRLAQLLRRKSAEVPTLAAPAPVPAAARFTAATFSNPAGSRAYKLYEPAGRATGPRPLLVMLHGCTQDPDDFAAGTRMNELADRHGLLVAYPAQASAANGMRCWNWFEARDQIRDQGEPSLIAGIVSEIAAGGAIDPARIYVAGLSAGGAMALILAETYPELFAAVGVHSGLPFGAARSAASALGAMQGGFGAGPPVVPGGAAVRTIVFHGDADATVNCRNGEEIVRQAVAREQAAHGTLRVTTVTETTSGRRHTRTVYRGAETQPLVEYWQIEGAGHAWSGGSSRGSYADEAGPDASAEMVRFFSEP